MMDDATVRIFPALRYRDASAALQWQKGKQILIWPENLAQGKAIVPTPPWSKRE